MGNEADDKSLDIRGDLAKVRIERAEELVETAKNELERGDYKSANNRAFYAMERALKAVLATEGISADSHTGILRTFNKAFIHEGNGEFTHDDYSIVQEAETVRQASDYDDFYVVKKEDCVRQVQNAEHIVEKVKKYLKAID